MNNEEQEVTINDVLESCREVITELAEAYEAEIVMLIWENSLPEKRDWLNEIMAGECSLGLTIERCDLEILEKEVEDAIWEDLLINICEGENLN